VNDVTDEHAFRGSFVVTTTNLEPLEHDMANDRIWNLTLTLPDEPERTLHVPQSEMVSALQAVMRGETPVEADLAVAPALAA
jgi:hypothetical protein